MVRSVLSMSASCRSSLGVRDRGVHVDEGLVVGPGGIRPVHGRGGDAARGITGGQVVRALLGPLGQRTRWQDAGAGETGAGGVVGPDRPSARVRKAQKVTVEILFPMP